MNDLYAKTTREIGEYVVREYKNGRDIGYRVSELVLPVIPEPVDPAAGATRTQTKIWEREIDGYLDCVAQIPENNQSLFLLSLDSALRQCKPRSK